MYHPCSHWGSEPRPGMCKKPHDWFVLQHYLPLLCPLNSPSLTWIWVGRTLHLKSKWLHTGPCASVGLKYKDLRLWYFHISFHLERQKTCVNNIGHSPSCFLMDLKVIISHTNFLFCVTIFLSPIYKICDMESPA